MCEQEFDWHMVKIEVTKKIIIMQLYTDFMLKIALISATCSKIKVKIKIKRISWWLLGL